VDRQREPRRALRPCWPSADNPDPLVRRSINIAIDSLSPHGCAECITRMTRSSTAEQGQESRSLMHLEAQMLIARLRARQ
jgi:hypothetical protein